MRILFILEYYSPHIGGVETFFNSLAHQLDEAGHSVTILTNRYDRKLLSKERQGRQIKIIRKSYLNRYFFTFFAWWHAIKLSSTVDLIHTTSYNAAIPARIAAWWSGKMTIITFHERYGDLWFRLPWMSKPAKYLHAWFERIVTKLNFDRFVGVSDFTKNALIAGGVPAHKVMRIYNGISYNGFPKHLGSGSDNFQFMFFGRVGYAKGVDLLMAAYEKLLHTRTNHRLLLVLPSKQTSQQKHILSQIENSGIQKYVDLKFDLEYKDLLQHISQADAIVIPSYSEGFCFAAVETMAIGAPIISSGQGALKEVVSGRHITMNDFGVDGLLESMSRAIDGDWEEVSLKKYPLSDTIDGYLNLYAELGEQNKA